MYGLDIAQKCRWNAILKPLCTDLRRGGTESTLLPVDALGLCSQLSAGADNAGVGAGSEDD